MPDTTTNLQLPYILAGQAQKHVTHNEALRLLDALVQIAVLDRHLTTPPASPVDGARYIVAAGGAGAWSGWDLNIAYRVDGAWIRLVPRPGWIAWVQDEAALLVWSGSAWAEVGAGSGGAAAFATLGIGGATADVTNRLAVSAPASLFSHAGGGHQVKVNKAAVGHTASVVFQDAWSGRAEIGLSGSDDFSLKVSADGLAWIEAFIMTATGQDLRGYNVSVPTGTIHPQVQYNAANTGGSSFSMTRWSADSQGPAMILRKSRGAVGAFGSVLAGDVLGDLQFSGAAASASFLSGFDARIRCAAAADFTSSASRRTSFTFDVRTASTLVTGLAVTGAAGVEFPSIGTTAAAANAYLDAAANNGLLRSTSSGRYKREVEPVEALRAEAVLQLRPVWYRSTAPADRDDWSWYGLIAEEVAVIEPRLVHWGYRDEDYVIVDVPDPDGGEPEVRKALRKGAQMAPDAVMYDRIAVLLLDVVRTQREQLATQDARIAMLEASLTA